MKKLFSTISILALLFCAAAGFTACSSGDDDNSSSGGTNTSGTTTGGTTTDGTTTGGTTTGGTTGDSTSGGSSSGGTSSGGTTTGETTSGGTNTYASYEIIFDEEGGSDYYTFKTNGVVTYYISALSITLTGSYTGDPTKDGKLNVTEYNGAKKIYTVSNGVLTDDEGRYIKRTSSSGGSSSGGTTTGGTTTGGTTTGGSSSGGSSSSGTTTGGTTTDTSDASVLANYTKYLTVKSNLLDDFKTKTIIALYGIVAQKSYGTSYFLFFFEDGTYCFSQGDSYEKKAISKGNFTSPSNPAIDGKIILKQKQDSFYGTEWSDGVIYKPLTITDGKGYYIYGTFTRIYGKTDFVPPVTNLSEEVKTFITDDSEGFKTKTPAAIFVSSGKSSAYIFFNDGTWCYVYDPNLTSANYVYSSKGTYTGTENFLDDETVVMTTTHYNSSSGVTNWTTSNSSETYDIKDEKLRDSRGYYNYYKL